jgi:MFS family permease
MVRVPGGKGSDGPVSVRSSFGSYRSALTDRPFLAFVTVASLCYAALTLMSASVVLFMRDELAFSPRAVMLVMAVGALCILFTIRYWGNMADRAGSAAAMLLSMFGHSAAAALCLFLAPAGDWAGPLLVVVIALTSLFAAAFNMAANRALLGYMSAAGRIPYTNVWQVTASFAVGVTPIAAGVMIDHWGLTGFRACFAASLILGLLFGATCRWIVKEPTELERREFIPAAASVESLEGNIIDFATRRREETEGPAPLDRTIRPAQ